METSTIVSEKTTKTINPPQYRPGASGPPEYHPEFAALPWAMKLLKSPTVRRRHGDWLRCDYRENTDTLMRRTFAGTDSIRAYVELTQYHPATGTVENMNLISLGTDLNAHQNILHGGIVATFLDEIVAVSAGLGLTAYLNISFKRPVKTPSVVLLRSRVVKKQGRKTICVGTIEDGMGGVYATAEGMYIEPAAKL